ncbi:MAG: hypothetical protein GZ087_03365 [Flavobacterium sp.]|nr:hypothetical protein [Flavobacterium sp.]
MKNPIFEQHPDLQKVYVTADGECFYQEADAKNHAKSLKEKAVKVVYNEQFLEVVGEEELDPADEDFKAFEAAEKEKSDAETQKAKLLADFDTETTKYPEALKLFKALGLEAENDKKDTIYPLIVAAKASAQEGVNTQE